MTLKIEDFRPESKTVTAYDRQCFKLYIMLLDADASGEEWSDAYKRIFEKTAIQNHERAFQHYQAHLKRAKWMTTTGYQQLL
ncbi:MAG: DUF2285 domain-containing protein [Devosiaceae bacterium]|nr:DUF2285 domain-containing protein [Devosiaceae bacterium]